MPPPQMKGNWGGGHPSPCSPPPRDPPQKRNMLGGGGGSHNHVSPPHRRPPPRQKDKRGGWGGGQSLPFAPPWDFFAPPPPYRSAAPRCSRGCWDPRMRIHCWRGRRGAPGGAAGAGGSHTFGGGQGGVRYRLGGGTPLQGGSEPHLGGGGGSEPLHGPHSPLGGRLPILGVSAPIFGGGGGGRGALLFTPLWGGGAPVPFKGSIPFFVVGLPISGGHGSPSRTPCPPEGSPLPILGVPPPPSHFAPTFLGGGLCSAHRRLWAQRNFRKAGGRGRGRQGGGTLGS